MFMTVMVFEILSPQGHQPCGMIAAQIHVMAVMVFEILSPQGHQPCGNDCSTDKCYGSDGIRNPVHRVINLVP